jgi:hypothetical protein
MIMVRTNSETRKLNQGQTMISKFCLLNITLYSGAQSTVGDRPHEDDSVVRHEQCVHDRLSNHIWLEV